MSQRVLLVDDDRELCKLLEDFLRLEGFTVSSVHDGEQAVARCRQGDVDLLVLDIMLPGLQGLEVLRRLRGFSDTPVLMLTARGEDTDRIVGLELGADDYLAKPCNPRELAARLRAIGRRSANQRSAPDAPVQVGELLLDPAERSVHLAGQSLELTSAEFNILSVLLRQSGQVVDKETLCRQALGRELTPYDRSVDVHVSSIRKKLAAHGGTELIKNVRGVGYQYLRARDG